MPTGTRFFFYFYFYVSPDYATLTGLLGQSPPNFFGVKLPVDWTQYPYTQKSLLYAGLIGGGLLILSAFFMPLGQNDGLNQSTPGRPTSTPAFDRALATSASTPTRSARSTQPLASPTAPPVTPTASPTPKPVVHIVEEFEVLGYIAAEYGTTVEKIMAVNNLDDPTRLQIGQKLLIPITVTPTPRATATPTTPPLTYIIQPGDVLLAVAAEFSTTVEAIMIANDIYDPRTLQIGQELIIPPDKGSIFGVPSVVHAINSGDTLLAVAAQYGSSVEDILANNPDLEPTRLQIGQKIAVPLTLPRAGSAATFSQARVTVPQPQLPGLLGLEEQMIGGVNQQRQIQGLPVYTVDAGLTQSARAHAQDMIGRGYFSHVTPEGATLQDRMAASGILTNWTGENIQRNVQPLDQSAAYALNWFMSSRPHRANILHANYSRIGVGVAEGPAGWYTFVLVFSGD